MEVLNFPLVISPAEVSLVGVDTQQAGRLLQGSVFDSLFAHLDDSQPHEGLFAAAAVAYQEGFWVGCTYTGDGVASREIVFSTGKELPVPCGSLALKFGVFCSPNYGGSGVWAFLSVCPFGLGGFLLQRDLTLTTPFSPAWLHYDAYQDGVVWRQKMTIFDSRAIPYFNKSGVTYKFTGFLFPSAW